MVRGTYFPWPLLQNPISNLTYHNIVLVIVIVCIPVSEKKVLKPWSGSAALRSSVKYPSGYNKTASVKVRGYLKVVIRVDNAYLNTMLKTIELRERKIYVSHASSISATTTMR